MKKQSIWLVIGIIIVLIPLIILLINFRKPAEAGNTQATTTAAAQAEVNNPTAPATQTTLPLPTVAEPESSATTPAELAETEAPVQQAARAYLAVEPAEISLILMPVNFTGSISGLDALLQSGLEVITQETSFGTAVCSIEEVGCPADNCFCSATNFWNYLNWDWAQNQWVASAVGASATTLSNHAVDGWRWQAFEDSQTPPPAPDLLTGSAMNYLLAKRDPVTGGYGSMGSTMDFLLAAGASGTPVEALTAPGGEQSLQDYILLEGAAYAEGDAGTAGKLAMGLSAAQMCMPENTKLPQDYYDPSTGAYSDRSLFQAFAILGVLSSGDSVPPEAIAYLIGQRQPGGGWAWYPGEMEDSNTTAIAIQALIAAGQPASSPVIIEALTYLKSFQNTDGGFSYSQEYLGASDGNSTAYAIQAILAAGQNPLADVWTVDGQNPLFYLLDRQLENGSFEWQAGSGSNDLATMQAVVALLNRPYPISTAGFSDCAP
jgi:hypothetical protein